MAAIESVGTMLEDGISGYAEQISGALITNLSPVIFTCVSLYFLLKGWMFLTGRAEGAIADTVITAFKVALISMVGLNTGNFVSYGIGFINGAESLLMSVLPESPASCWTALDTLWSTIGDGVLAIWEMISKLDWDEIGYAFLLVLMLFAFFIAGAFLTLAGLGVFIIAKLSLVVILGFGPLFICCLMFPVTKTWFDGWIKACMTNIFTVVLLAAVISLVSTVFEERVSKISEIFSMNFADGGAADILTALFTFIIVCFGLATLVKAVPSLAAGVTGGIGMGAVGLGQMLRGVGTGATQTVHSTVTGARALGHGAVLAGKGIVVAENAVGTMAMKAAPVVGQAASAGKRAIRAINAAKAMGSAPSLPQRTDYL